MFRRSRLSAFPARGLLFLLAVLAYDPVLAGISGSKHDLSSSGGGEIKATDISFSCYFCHSVHTPEEGAGGPGGYPMWNKDLSELGPYFTYSSSTLVATPSNPPNLETLACLSCHDGTVAVNVIRTGVLGTMEPTDRLTGRASDLGTDLSNDHPVAVEHDPLANPRLHELSNATDAGIKFYGALSDQVECASCHNPHDPSHPPFLRLANTGSALCRACHLR